MLTEKPFQAKENSISENYPISQEDLVKLKEEGVI